MDLTFSLIPGGYAILDGGQLWISQPFQPDVPGFVPYPDEASATAAAQALIASLTADTTPAG
ncbi:Uncharacterised protein [Burkholderia pseudomallei]|nr:Uncharacterised protein [Burkholderia pseudomallei]